MLDTVRIFTDKFELKKENKFQVNSIIDYCSGELKYEKLYCNFDHFNLDIRQTDKSPLLLLQTSLPKILFKTSLFEISENDIEQSINAIESRLDQAGISIDKNDLNDFSISRVDLCKNVKVEYNILDYLLLLSQYSISRRDKIEIKKETVSFRNTGQELTFYNKIKEILDTEKDQNILTMVKDSPQNILRVESRLRQKRIVDRELYQNIKFIELFNFKNAKDKMLKDFDCLVKNSSEQIDFNFKENSELLRFIETKRERNAFKEFLAVKGVKRFLIEFQFDWSKIRDFLLAHYSRMQVYRLLKDLRTYQDLIVESNNRDLIQEIRYKIAA